MKSKEAQLKNKIVNRSAVYRAIYYSGFEWTRIKVLDLEKYTLTSKATSAKIYLEHSSAGENNDILTATATDTLDPRDELRLSRLFAKILRRTKYLTINQDLVSLTKEEEKCNV